MSRSIHCFLSYFLIIATSALYAQTSSFSYKGIDVDTFVVLQKSKIHYHEKGTGIPVVFVSGLGDDNGTWQTVQDSISKYALTLSYDRSGLGKSEYHKEKKDLISIVHELDRVITTIKLPQPFILVGHSLGCQVIKKYASVYPEKIKGIIFLDPGYNEDMLRSIVSDSLWQKREQALKQYLPAFNDAQNEELKYVNKIAAQCDTIMNVPEVPIVLYTATLTNPDFPCSEQEFQVKQRIHNLWLQSMPTAKHKIVPASRHYIQNDEPGLVINEIKGMLLQ